MEIVQNKHVAEAESSFPMKLADQEKYIRIDNDIMTRRLKNRERQRRYRARKRLEEEIKKASTIKHPTQTGTYFQPNGVANNPLTRVHCSRNWKKEARNASVSRGLEEASCNSSNMAAKSSTSEGQIQCQPSHPEPQSETRSHSEPPTEQLVSETAKKVLGRRNWKADARKKKN
ncbi:uncharacterized protein LOC111463869 [Cucurbita moschata]|uniref:Uncharacterized protein LOC111463869 n=1 Tax=Cucurbita moschata TaxID=3662 RepID=A0A6J1HFL3_CUCMO|nr:uncharacterized protein LOC111463869 [Cucurbita moschata]XP_022963573.1 uncharacterized protein LOC111463869 [Cucurbita moschata]